MALVVLNCVGLTPRHLGPDTPHLSRLAADGFSAPLQPVLPAVTTSAQTTMLTGTLPQEHGIVGNGWYFRELGEVWLWRQSRGLVQRPVAWRPGTRVLNHFWWYAMNAPEFSATVTPRPVYHHDGRKSPDIYALPATLKQTLLSRHGDFPLFNFWGPMANLASTRWIAESFATACEETKPDLALCYLPHLDYDLQRFGPVGPHLAPNLRDLDACAGIVIAAAQKQGAQVVVVSEYGIAAVDRGVFINRALREAGLLAVSCNTAGELLDPGASRAFAVCDHQLAHVYVRDPGDLATVQALLGRLDGIDRVYALAERREIGLDHPRSGELVAISAPRRWFVYDYWLQADRRPDFAQAVEIHKKPGYDPRELLFDPKGGKRRAGMALLRKKLGFRYLLDPCPLDDTLIRGSHGRAPADPLDGPVIIGPRSLARDSWHQTDVASIFAG